MDTLKNKVALIVDANSTVGTLTSKTLARYSVTLCLCGTDDNALRHLAEDCVKIGLAENRVAVFAVSDIHDKTQIDATVQQVVRKFNALHALIYLYDHPCNKTFEDTTADDLMALHIYHVESPLTWSQRAIPHLKKTKGNIVALTSGVSRKPVVGMFPYALTKAAEDHLIRTVALDVAAFGIRVNSVSPLYSDYKAGGIAEERAAINSSVAEYISYLTADVASFITGQCISIGKGYTIDTTLTAS